MYVYDHELIVMMMPVEHLFKLEDVAVGIWIEQYEKKKGDDRFNNAGCESDYILWYNTSSSLSSN